MPDHTEPLLKATGIVRTFKMGATPVEVLRGVDLTINRGEFVAICGSSGAGKSTLLHILGLLDRADAGQYLFQGRELAKLGDEEASRVRNRLFGFVFQFFHLLPEFTALENVMMPARLGAGGFRWLREAPEVTRRAKELLEMVGLGARLDHLPTQLSGGERQRVAIARSLINQPELVFCDEPTGNLDSATAEEMFGLLRKLNAERGITFLIVTHDPSIAARADRVLVMKDGLFVSDTNGSSVPMQLAAVGETAPAE